MICQSTPLNELSSMVVYVFYVSFISLRFCPPVQFGTGTVTLLLSTDSSTEQYADITHKPQATTAHMNVALME